MTNFEPIMISLYRHERTDRTNKNQENALAGIYSGFLNALNYIARSEDRKPGNFSEADQRKRIFYRLGKDESVKELIKKCSRRNSIDYESFLSLSRNNMIINDDDPSKNFVVTHKKNVSLKNPGPAARLGNRETIISTGSLTEGCKRGEARKSFNRGYLAGAHMPVHLLLNSPSGAEEEIHCEDGTCAMHPIYDLKTMDMIIEERQKAGTEELFCRSTTRLIRGNLIEQGMTL